MSVSPSKRHGSDEDDRRGADLLVWIAFGLAALLLLLHEAAARTLWGDELFSLGVANRSWMGLVGAAVRNVVHPPLFYALLKLWIRIGGEHPLWLRALPVLFSAASLFPTVLLGRELGLSRRAMRLAVLLVVCSGSLIRYGQELRMYSLLQLLSMTSLCLFARFLRDERVSVAGIAGLAVVNAVLVYTHYYGWIVLGCQGLFLLVARRSRLGSWLSGLVPVVIAFLPWLWLVRRRAADIGGLEHNLAGLSRPGWRDLLEYFGRLFGPSRGLVGGYLPSLLIVVLALGLALGALLRRGAAAGAPEERFAAGFLAVFAFVPVALVLAASFVLPQPVFAPRYLIIAACPFFLLLGLLLDRTRPRAVGLALGALVAGWAVVGAAEKLAIQDRVAWGDLVHAMLTRCPPAPGSDGVPVLVLGYGNRRPILYYLKRESAEGFEVRVVEDLSEIPPGGGWIASQIVPGSRPNPDPDSVRYWGGVGLSEMEASLLERGFRLGCVFQSGRPPEGEGYVISVRPAAPRGKAAD